MYCVNCGVELAKSEEQCPLCGTKVYHPEIMLEKKDGPYPSHEGEMERVSPSGVLFIITVLFLLPFLITILLDMRLNGSITWSGYVAGSLFVTYIIAILPNWFSRPNPVVLVPLAFVAILLFLLYINNKTHGQWFFPFALPVTLGVMIILTAVISLVKYVRKGLLFIFGGAFILGGFLMLVVEYLLNLTFDLRDSLIWSYYPLVVFVLFGITLIVIGCSKTLRESLYKKFFI